MKGRQSHCERRQTGKPKAVFHNAEHGLWLSHRFVPVCRGISAGLLGIVLCRAAFVPVRLCVGFAVVAGYAKMYIFTAADGGNSNKMRNFVS
jgi:hypothetical protein